MDKELIAISATSRSGSSMIMAIQQAVHGKSCIITGYNGWEAAMADATAEQITQLQAFNPDGFFECSETFNGIMAVPPAACEGLNFFKLMVANLGNSDATLISKMIVILRNPLKVVASQRLMSDFFNIMAGVSLDTEDDLFEEYIRDIQTLNEFIEDFPPFDAAFFDYDAICKQPAVELARMQVFIGEGDYSAAYNIPQVSPRVAIDGSSAAAVRATKMYEEILLRTE